MAEWRFTAETGLPTQASLCVIYCGQHFGVPLSVSFHQCYILIFIYMLLLPEGQTRTAWEPSNTATLLLIFGNVRQKTTCVLFVLEGVKKSGDELRKHVSSLGRSVASSVIWKERGSDVITAIGGSKNETHPVLERQLLRQPSVAWRLQLMGQAYACYTSRRLANGGRVARQSTTVIING